MSRESSCGNPIRLMKSVERKIVVEMNRIVKVRSKMLVAFQRSNNNHGRGKFNKLSVYSYSKYAANQGRPDNET